MTGFLYLVAKPDLDWEIILIPKHDSMMQILDLVSKVEMGISQGTGTGSKSNVVVSISFLCGHVS